MQIGLWDTNTNINSNQFHSKISSTKWSQWVHSFYTYTTWLVTHLMSLTKLSCVHSLTHWGRVTHICVVKLTIIDSDNGFAPGRRKAIIWTNAGILLIGPLGTNVSEVLIEIQTFSFKKMHLKMASANWRPFCLGLNVLTFWSQKWPHFSYNFKCIFTTQKICILIQTSLKFVPSGPIDNMLTLG